MAARRVLLGVLLMVSTSTASAYSECGIPTVEALFDEPLRNPPSQGRDRLGRTPLMLTAAWTHTDLGMGLEQSCAREAEALLRAGADINAQDRRGMTALMWAAGWHHPEIVRVLLKHQADVSVRDKLGRTALTWAARAGLPDIVEPLLQHGAQVGVTDALLLGQETRALQLIAAGEAISTRGPYAETALMIAAEKGYPAAVRALRQRGAPVNARDEKGRTALLQAVGAPPQISQLGDRIVVPDPAQGNRPALVRYLVREGADPDARDRVTGATPLIQAIEYGTVETVAALLAAGARVNTRGSRSGETPLIHAVRQKRLDVTALLLAHGADPNARDKYRQTALHHAASESVELVRLLLRYRAAVNVRGSNGSTPLLDARDAAVLRVLIESGADVNARSNRGISALMGPARARNTEEVRLLLAAGAHVGLLEALYLGDNDAALRLIRRKSGLTQIGPLDETALMVAARQGPLEVVDALLARGVAVNARDSYGYTALMMAAERGDAGIVGALLEAGADVGARTEYRRVTALSLARKGNHPHIVQILESAAFQSRQATPGSR